MKIVFMGTPDFAVPCLQALIDGEHEVAGVITQPDKPKGRGHHIQYPPVKELALKHRIEVLQPPSLKNGAVQADLERLQPDLIVVVAYGKILPKEVLDFPAYGCINVHASLLPKYRGAGPIQWSVLNGETVTGVTTMYMAEGLDTGDMLLQAAVEIGKNETASELHDRLSVLGAEVLVQTLEQVFDGAAVRIPQNDSDSCYAPMLSKEISQIDFTEEAHLVHNKIRGLSTWPCAVTLLSGKRLKVYHAEIAQGYSGQCGEVLCAKTFVVGCGNKSAVRFTEVQYEGSKRMPGEAFLRGKRVETGTVLGG